VGEDARGGGGPGPAGAGQTDGGAVLQTAEVGPAAEPRRRRPVPADDRPAATQRDAERRQGVEPVHARRHAPRADGGARRGRGAGGAGAGRSTGGGPEVSGT